MRSLRVLSLMIVCCIVAVGIGENATSRVKQPRIRLFGKPVRVSADENQAAAEPSIRAARDGTLYVVAPTGLGGVRTQEGGSGGDLIWRSDDKGKTWTYLGSYDQAAGGGDADIAPDGDGVLWGSGLTLVNTTAAISTNKGDSWCVNPVGALDTNVDRQWTETYKAAPFAFMVTGQTTEQKVILSRLENTGGCPTVSNTVSVSADDEYQWPGEIAVDERNDFVFASYNTCGLEVDETACEDRDDQIIDRIVVARTDLDLGNPRRFVVLKTLGDSFDSFTGLDVDQAGNVYITWTERRPSGKKGRRGRTNSYVSVSKNHGSTWSKPIKINRYARTTTFPWLVAGSKGRIAVAYYGTRRLGPSPERLARPKASAPRWKVYVSYSLNAQKRTRRFKEVRATRLVHEGNVCTSGTDCQPGTRDLLDFFQIDLDPCGKMVIAYTDNSRDKVGAGGQRTANEPEFVTFVGQTSAKPRFYRTPLNPEIC